MNILSIVALQWIVSSNRSGSFCSSKTKDTGQAFTGLEKNLWETFLPHIFFGKLKNLPPIVGDLSMFWVKKACLGLQNPMKSLKEKCDSFLCASLNLIVAVKGERNFSTVNHSRLVKGWRLRVHQDWRKVD